MFNSAVISLHFYSHEIYFTELVISNCIFPISLLKLSIMKSEVQPSRIKTESLFHSKRRNELDISFDVFKDCKYLITALTYFGMDVSPWENHNSVFKCCAKFCKFVQIIIFHSIYIDYLVMCFHFGRVYPQTVKPLCAYGLSATFTFILWHILRANKKRVRDVLKQLFRLTWNLNFKYRSISVMNALTVIIFVQPIFSTLLMVYLMTFSHNRYYTFFFYARKFDHFETEECLYLFFKYLAQCVLLQIFPGLVTLLYSMVCFRVCQKLRLYRKSFLRFKHETQLSVSCYILRSYLQFIDSISKIENVFSIVSFFLVVANSLSVFTILATTFYYTEVTAPTRAESFFTFITAGIYLIINISIASQVTIDIRKNAILFHLLLDHWKCNSQVISYEFEVLAKAIKKRPVVQMSGWEVFYFQRNGILAVFGTLLTYGLLILQLKSE